MAVGKSLLFLSVVAISLGAASAPPRAAVAAEEKDCFGSPGGAVTVLPEPIRKWGHISCTQFGHMLSSREGWVWAWLDGSGSVVHHHGTAIRHTQLPSSKSRLPHFQTRSWESEVGHWELT